MLTSVLSMDCDHRSRLGDVVMAWQIFSGGQSEIGLNRLVGQAWELPIKNRFRHFVALLTLRHARPTARNGFKAYMGYNSNLQDIYLLVLGLQRRINEEFTLG
jgi:hypothetical protein